jgi:ABC transporter substrate binding protein
MGKPASQHLRIVVVEHVDSKAQLGFPAEDLRHAVTDHGNRRAFIGIGWYKSGFEPGKMASRVLRGASPASIPMVNVVEKKLVLNEAAVARKLGISFPASLKAKAGR